MVNGVKVDLPEFLTNPDPNLYLEDDYVVLDWETTNIDKGSPYVGENNIVLAGWIVVKDGKTRYKDKFGGEGSHSELLEDISNAKFLVAHNIKFELGWLVRCGYDLASKPVFCTQIAEYVIAGNRPWGFFASLNECLARRGMAQKENLVSLMIKAQVCPSDIPQAWLAKYCKSDNFLCNDLFLHQRAYMHKHGLLPVMYSRCLLTPVLVDLEYTGMQLDEERVTKLWKDKCEELEDLQIKLSAFSEDINWRSNQQVADFLFNQLKFKIPTNYRGDKLLNDTKNDTWPDGVPKTDAPTLALLKAKTKKQAEFIELYRKLAKVTKAHENLTKMYNCCRENDGKLHFTFNQTATRNHRLSSSGKKYKLQGQNQDRNFKPLFRPRHDGWLFEEDDAAQLEYRFAVDYAKDEAGLHDIVNKVDVHYLSAISFFDEYDSLPDGIEKKELRTKAKAETFSPLYYKQSGDERQTRYYNAFRQKHKQINELHEDIIEQVVQTKQYRTFSGLVFYWPHCKRSRTGYAKHSTEICNYFCSNGATAEIIPLGVVYMWHYIRALGLKSIMCNTVHDSIETEVHPDEATIIPQLAKQAIEVDSVEMLDKLYGYKFTTPLESESEVSTHWGNSPYWEEKYLG